MSTTQPLLNASISKPRASGRYCTDCCFKIRGKNHRQGRHHKVASRNSDEKGHCSF